MGDQSVGITWKGAGKLVKKGKKTYQKVKPIVDLFLDEEDERDQSGTLVTKGKKTYPKVKPIVTYWDFIERCMAGKHRMYNSWKTWARECDDRSHSSAFYDEEEDHSVGRSWQEKWDFVERCMAGKPRMYNSWKTWARECDDRSKNSAFYDEEEDENVGSDALGCYLFPQAPKCRQWDMSDDDDDVGFTDLPRRSLGQVSAKCYYTQQKLCGQCGGDNNCRMACNRRNAGRLARACGYRRQLRSIPSWTRA